MHTGALMAVRQFLGQYLVYAGRWQRVLIAVGAVVGGALLLAVGIVSGHIMLALIGAVLLLVTGKICVQVVRGRRRAGPP
jgi:hypothetical protein